MEGEYFTSDDPPSCAVTCIVMVAASIVMVIPLMISIIFGDESTFFLYILITSIIGMIVLFPVAWWAAKRIKKWARINVERREEENQYTD